MTCISSHHTSFGAFVFSFLFQVLATEQHLSTVINFNHESSLMLSRIKPAAISSPFSHQRLNVIPGTALNGLAAYAPQRGDSILKTSFLSHKTGRETKRCQSSMAHIPDYRHSFIQQTLRKMSASQWGKHGGGFQDCDVQEGREMNVTM